MSSQPQAFTQLHIGLGSFHRAHQAIYQHKLHQQGDERWHITAGNIRPDMQSTIDALIAQNGAYTLETVTPGGQYQYELIESIRTIIQWDEELNGLAKVAADPATRIISFTVTEAGYYLDENGKIDSSHPDIKNDLAGSSCCTLYGAMSRLLSTRKNQSAGPVTLLNCDNLRHNGDCFSSGLSQYLELSGDEELKDWVNTNTSTPNSMVDRITPRPAPELTDRVKAATGRTDLAAIMSEEFIQWVIEDDFIAGRPAWENVAVQMVEDVMPYEEAKIRILNATHSCVAWAGTLRGYNFIHEDLLDSDVRELAYNYVTNDVIPCLNTEDSAHPLDLAAYRDTVLDRFSNPYIKDTNQRVAMDGFSKIPGFILPSIMEGLEAGRSIDSVAMLPALFLAFLQREQRGDIPYTYEDQVTGIETAARICASENPLKMFAAEPMLFGTIANDERLYQAIEAAFAKVEQFIND